MDPRAKQTNENVDKKSQINADKKSQVNFEAKYTTQEKLSYKMSWGKRNNSKFIFVRPK